MNERTKWWLTVLALFSFVISSWGVALLAVKQTNVLSLPAADFATLTFGASSLFLFIFSFGLGLLGVVGWQAINVKLQEFAAIAAQEAVEDKLEIVENELRGRTIATIGYITGEMSLRYEDGLIEVVDAERLSEAVATLRQGYDFLSRINDEKAEYMVLNNLVFYSLVSDDKERARFLLEKAEDLMRVGRAHDAIHLMLTASGVFARYAANETKRNEVIALLKGFSENSRLSSKQRSEAKYYLRLALAGTPPEERPA